ncbi:SIR2 family protein [Variovorax sp. V118]|uniref:SIR2 family protein n=1 Tax=Variovorax sp. V118 TaxID=3065954 RepID=UPI0034E89D38
MANSDEVAAAILKHVERLDLDPILFAGAGVSMRAGLPDWKGLLQALAEGVREHAPLMANTITESISQGKLTKAADLWSLVDEVPIGDKLRRLSETLSTYDAKALYGIAGLPFRACITTNFDRAILDAFSVVKKAAVRDYRFGDKSLAEAVWEKNFYVARIHGSVELPADVILSGAQFDQLLKNDVYIELLTRAFTNHAVLFLGFSFYDPAIRHVFELVDKRFGQSPPGRHLAVIPQGMNEFLQKSARLNISVIEYDTANNHAALWDGISIASSKLRVKKKTALLPVTASPLRPLKKYLSACYARAQVATSTTALSEIVLEGVISAIVQAKAPKGIEFFEIKEAVRTSLGIRGDDIDAPANVALTALVNSNIIRKQRSKIEKGLKYSWIDSSKINDGLDGAIAKLVAQVLNRAYVQEGWTPRDNAVKDVIDHFLLNVIQHRGWDLGAAFAAGRPPDAIDVAQILSESGASLLSALDRERLLRTIDSLFLRPTSEEAELLGEIGRVSFALELAFQAPRSTLFHQATLPRKIYLDANVLMPSIIEGHPNQEIYSEAIARIKTNAEASSIKCQVIVLYGYLNEIVSHRRSALEESERVGDDHDNIVRSDAMFHGTTNMNAFAAAYVRHLNNSGASGFKRFIDTIAPYNSESELSKFLASKGFLIVHQTKDPLYAKLYGLLEKANAAKLVGGKEPILLEHDALQLRLLIADIERQEKSVFVTADRRLCEDVGKSSYVELRDSMVSHIGLLQLVDLLVGLKLDKRQVGSLLWSNTVSDKTEKIRSYLVAEALEQHDAAMAMEMHRIVDSHAERISRELDRQGVDLDTQNPKKRAEAFRTLASLEKGFFEGMKVAIKKIEDRDKSH